MKYDLNIGPAGAAHMYGTLDSLDAVLGTIANHAEQMNIDLVMGDFQPTSAGHMVASIYRITRPIAENNLSGGAKIEHGIIVERS